MLCRPPAAGIAEFGLGLVSSIKGSERKEENGGLGSKSKSNSTRINTSAVPFFRQLLTRFGKKQTRLRKTGNKRSFE